MTMEVCFCSQVFDFLLAYKKMAIGLVNAITYTVTPHNMGPQRSGKRRACSPENADVLIALGSMGMSLLLKNHRV